MTFSLIAESVKAMFVEKNKNKIKSMIKGLVHFQNKNFLIIYSPPYHPTCSCLSFFSRKEIKVFEENIPGFFSI